MPKIVKRAFIKRSPTAASTIEQDAEVLLGALIAEGDVKYQPITAIRHAMRMAGLYTTATSHKCTHPYLADNARADLALLLQHPDFDSRDMLALFDLVAGMLTVPIDGALFDPATATAKTRRAN